MNVEEINKYIKMLIGNLTFSMDYNNLVNGSKRLLLVEGQTDKKFIEKLLNEDVICVVANKAFGINQGLTREMVNCKSAIMRTVYGMSQIPMLISCPKAAKDWAVYGMVDLDFDKETDSGFLCKRLFVTDTHDLETLLLSTDINVLDRLDGCRLSIEDVKKAFFIAYQLGIVSMVLRDKKMPELSLAPIAATSRADVNYGEFTKDYKTDLKKLLDYLADRNDSHVSAQRMKRLFDESIKDKRLKKRMDANGIWNSEWKQFEYEKTTDFWEVVNGHDILSILRFINQDVALRYDDSKGYALNRQFELDLINHYEYATLEKTKLYKDMREEKIVTDILSL